MALDIQGLTKVINSYLSSISEVGQNVQEAMDASERRRQFTDTLGEAIKAETQKKLVDFPDIPSLIQKNMESHMRVDTTFPTAQENAAAVTAANSSESASSAGSGNADAYKGQLSAEALQELAKSGYFSGNLVQSNLFNESAEGTTSSSSSSSAFDTSSLSDLNAKYLLSAYVNKNTDAAKSVFGDFSL